MPTLLDHQHVHAFLLSVVRISVWLVLLAVIFLPLERLTALHPRKFFCKSLLGDIGFYFISGLIPALLLAPPMALAAMAAHAVVPYSVHAAVASLPIWARALAALVVGEIGFYWGHRWSHEIPFLWRFHSVHHNPEQIYFLISARAHPIDNVFTRLCGFVPIYVLGIATPLTPSGGTVSALLVMALTMWGFLIHANVRWRLGPLEWVISTPAFHHWHHTAAEPRDRNFASMLPCMDWIFGTFYLPRHWPAAYGITETLPGSIAGQLLYPLRAPANLTGGRIPAAGTTAPSFDSPTTSDVPPRQFEQRNRSSASGMFADATCHAGAGRQPPEIEMKLPDSLTGQLMHPFHAPPPPVAPPAPVAANQP